MRPLHILFALTCAVTWGFVFVAIRWGLEELPPLLFVALRFVVCLPLLFLVGLKPPAPWRFVIGIGLAMGVLQFGFLFTGIRLGMPAGLASLVIQSQAFFTVILAALMMGDRPGPRRIAGMLLAFGGLAVIAMELPGGGTRAGLLLVLAAGLSWAVSNIITKRAQATDAFALMVWVSVVPPIPLLLGSLLLEGTQGFQALATLSWTGIFAVLYNGFGAHILGFGLWSWLLRRNPASRVAPFSLLVPVFGMSFAALFLGETLTPLKLAACVLVLAGLALTVISARTGPADPVSPRRT